MLSTKMLEPTKKICYIPNQGNHNEMVRRGTILRNQIPIHAGWATYKVKSNFIIEVLPPEWKFSAPHQGPQVWDLGEREEVALESLALKASRFDHRNSIQLRVAETPLLEGIHKVSSTRRNQGKEVISEVPEPDIPASMRGFPGSKWKQRHWQQ